MNNDHQHLQFAETVTREFSFLQDYGFQPVEALPTLVRYRCGDLEVRVHHGLGSPELVFEIERGEERFGISNLIAFSDPLVANRYRDPMVRTQSAMNTLLQQLADLVRRYGERALRNDPSYYEVLRQQHKASIEKYWLNMRCSQVRPKAEEAFREGRYREAAELYREIQAALTPAEVKKLAIAEKRSQGN